MKIYVASTRCGCELGIPEVFKTEAEAKTYITESIAQCVKDEFSGCLKAYGIDIKDNDAVLNWASDRDYVNTYNTDIYDTFTYSDDWIEFRIDEVEVDV